MVYSKYKKFVILLITASIPGKHCEIGSVLFFQGCVHDPHCTQENDSTLVIAPLIIQNSTKLYKKNLQIKILELTIENYC